MTLQSFIAPSSPVIVHRSPWHSPVPYLFGGLGAMLSLIAFALLILACTYSKHHHRESDRNNEEGERDLEAGNLKLDNNDKELPHVFEEKYLVIMAGQENPTFLATPVSSRPTMVYSCSCQRNVSEKSSTWEENENEKEKEKEGDQLQVRSMGNDDTSNQLA